MKYRFSHRYQKDVKRLKKRNFDLKKLIAVQAAIIAQKFTSKHRHHKLKGEYAGYYDCHISDDWIVVYEIEENEIIFRRTGTHQDIFKKNY